MARLKTRFIDLLASLDAMDGQQREPAIRRFFEQNPKLLVGAEFVDPKIVVSKYRIGNRVCDFAYTNATSGFDYLRCIEIEDPTKRIFTNKDEFSAEFNHALQQVHDWLHWCSLNRNQLDELSRIIEHQFERSPFFLVTGVLIYGRRSEIDNPTRKDRWRHKCEAEGRIVKIRTYDGLMEESWCAFEQSAPTKYDPVCVALSNGRLDRKL